MWSKLAQLFLKYLALPLIEKGLAALLKLFKNWQAGKKYYKKAKEKTEAYKNAKTKKESDDAFSDLP